MYTDSKIELILTLSDFIIQVSQIFPKHNTNSKKTQISPIEKKPKSSLSQLINRKPRRSTKPVPFRQNINTNTENTKRTAKTNVSAKTPCGINIFASFEKERLLREHVSHIMRRNYSARVVR